MRGLGNRVKHATVKETVRMNKIDILLIQETKLRSVPNDIVKEVWGNSSSEWCCREVVGSAGGILLIWSSSFFLLRDQWVGCYSISVLLEDLSNNSVWLVSSVYGPSDSGQREMLWRELDDIRSRWNGPLCIGGDWNIIRFPSEKLGCSRISSDMVSFSDWVNKHSLVDLPLGGAMFTWSNHQTSPALSHLDVFLISSDWLDLFPEVCQIALPKPTSDHCPILL